MPRKSAEARAAAAWRTANQAPAPPAHLSREAKALWVDITSCRAPDYFDAGATVLLEMLIAHVLQSRRIWAEIERHEVGSREHKRLVGLGTKLSTSIASLATKLRLSPSSVMRRADGRLTERGGPADPLLGGAALNKVS